MSFWDELKQLGKEIGEEVSNLGDELKQIGKDTIEEIKEDPAKYIKESAIEVANGVGKVAIFTATEVIPRIPEAMNRMVTHQVDQALKRDDLTSEQREKVEQIREKLKE